MVIDHRKSMAFYLKNVEKNKEVLPIIEIQDHIENKIEKFCNYSGVDLDNCEIVMTGRLINTSEGLCELVVILDPKIYSNIDHDNFDYQFLYEKNIPKDNAFAKSLEYSNIMLNRTSAIIKVMKNGTKRY